MKLSIAAVLVFGAGQLGAAEHLQLFVLMGQSNMAGRGAMEAADKAPIPRVFALNKELQWVPAVDPLHFDKPTIAGVSIGRSFARVLAKANPEAAIGLVPCAVGGTTLEQWKPGGELYEQALRRTREAMKSGTLRAVLWHQGESDSGTQETASSYGARWTTMMQKFREDLGVKDAALIVGALGEFLYDRTGNKSPFARVVNEQLALIPVHVPRAAFVSSAGLRHQGDELHFDAASLREFGRRFGLAYLSLDPEWTQKEKIDEAR